MENTVNYHFKIVMIGNLVDEKTKILQTYIGNDYDKDYSYKTNDSIIFTKNINIDDKKIELEIKDLIGQDRYKIINKNDFKEKNGLMFIFNISELNSFKFIETQKSIILENINDNLINTLIAIKSNKEVIENVSIEKAKNFSKELKMKFFEIDIDNKEQINDIFNYILKELIDKRNKEKNETKINRFNLLNSIEDYNKNKEISHGNKIKKNQHKHQSKKK
jgi:GTPase SAR1 family protein